MKIKESELRALLEEVAADLSKAFAEEKASLAKSQKLAKDGEEESPEPPKAPENEVSASPEDEEKSPAPPAEPPPAQPPAMDQEPAMDQGAEMTPENLQAEYAKLSPDELDMHIKAAMAAKAAAVSASANPPSEAPSKEMTPDEGVQKSEILKLEAEIKELKELAKSQNRDVENLTKALKVVVEQPLRKAVTSVPYDNRTAPEKKEWTVTEIHSHLKSVAANPNLAKSDRQLINDFYDRRVSVEKLAHLFQK